jgi:hypothetical protein
MQPSNGPIVTAPGQTLPAEIGRVKPRNRAPVSNRNIPSASDRTDLMSAHAVVTPLPAMRSEGAASGALAPETVGPQPGLRGHMPVLDGVRESAGIPNVNRP